MVQLLLRRAASDALFLQTVQIVFAHLLSVFLAKVIISYTNSIGNGHCFATARSAWRGFFLQTVQNMFAHLLGVFLTKVMISSTNSNGDGHLLLRRAMSDADFFAKQAKYVRSPGGWFLDYDIFSYTTSGRHGSSFDMARNARRMHC